MVSESTAYFGPVRLHPRSELRRIPRNARPRPHVVAEARIDISEHPPSVTTVLTKMCRQKREPDRFITLTVAREVRRSAFRIEAIGRRITPIRADVALLDRASVI